MEIEKDIPMPPITRSELSVLIRAMEKGDSILFPEYAQAENARCVGYKLGYKMSTRKLKDGWRIWRTE